MFKLITQAHWNLAPPLATAVGAVALRDFARQATFHGTFASFLESYVRVTHARVHRLVSIAAEPIAQRAGTYDAKQFVKVSENDSGALAVRNISASGRAFGNVTATMSGDQG